jgi:hypothetical protein
MDTLAMFAGAFVPSAHRAFIQTEGFDNRLNGTAT